ncbi:hypothetical protein ACOSQ4_027363 [Xanthoceras sorbifolium]
MLAGSRPKKVLMDARKFLGKEDVHKFLDRKNPHECSQFSAKEGVRRSSYFHVDPSHLDHVILTLREKKEKLPHHVVI